tara:strand:+ start:5802 stop:6065 length:264 start_codon:yes stop_codon:yes gene_type:complete
MNNSMEAQKKCLFCHMNTIHRYLRVNVCEICRDQLFDFVWVTVVQAIVVVVFALGPLFFIVEEVLLFAVLIFIKHRFPPPWQHDHRE